MNSMLLASVTSLPFLTTSSTRSEFVLVWISLMKFVNLLHGLWYTLSKPNLVFDLEIMLYLPMFINIFLVLPLCFFQDRYKLNSNIVNHMAWSLTIRFMTLFTPSMSNLGCKPWFTKKNVSWVDECTMLL